MGNIWTKQLPPRNKQITILDTAELQRKVGSSSYSNLCTVYLDFYFLGHINRKVSPSLWTIFSIILVDIYLSIPLWLYQCHSPRRLRAPSSCSLGCCSLSYSPPSSAACGPRSSWWRWAACSRCSYRPTCSAPEDSVDIIDRYYQISRYLYSIYIYSLHLTHVRQVVVNPFQTRTWKEGM